MRHSLGAALDFVGVRAATRDPWCMFLRRPSHRKVCLKFSNITFIRICEVNLWRNNRHCRHKSQVSPVSNTEKPSYTKFCGNAQNFKDCKTFSGLRMDQRWNRSKTKGQWSHSLYTSLTSEPQMPLVVSKKELVTVYVDDNAILSPRN